MRQVHEGYAKAGREQVDAIAGENRRLKEQVERLTQDLEHYRVLIVASIDKSIEVYADPKVRVQVVCLPETRTNEERERAEEWALGHVPNEFKGMLNDTGIRPDTYSTHCMDKTAFRYYLDCRQAHAYLEQLDGAIEEIKQDVGW